MSTTVLLLGLGLVMVAVLTAAAAAVRSVSRIWLRHWVEQRLVGGDAVPLSTDDIRRLLLAASTSVALVAFGAGVTVGVRSHATPLVLIEQLVVGALLLLLVGQLIPRALGRRWGTSLVPVLVPVLRVLAALLSPLVLIARELAGIGRRVVVTPDPTDEREALEDLLREGELEGVGDADESAIITGVVDFSVMRVRDVMTPRGEIFALDHHTAFAESARQIALAKYSRVPVMDGGLDHIIGMWHAFDVLKSDLETPPPLRAIVRAPESTPASDLLGRMLRHRVHLAVVHDAAGHTTGLVSLEDLLEELVGDIRDEHDEPLAV
jgi:putative hemolysin